MIYDTKYYNGCNWFYADSVEDVKDGIQKEDKIDRHYTCRGFFSDGVMIVYSKITKRLHTMSKDRQKRIETVIRGKDIYSISKHRH